MNIKNKRVNIIGDPKTLRMVEDYYQQLCAKKFDNRIEITEWHQR